MCESTNINIFVFMPERSVDDQVLLKWRRLGPREREVALLVAEGKTNKEIAQHLTIAYYTVKTHVRNILGKFELDNRNELWFELATNGGLLP